MGVGSGGQYCRSHVECMGRAVMPSDVEPEDLFESIGFRKLLRLLSGTNETILDVLWGGVI